MKFHLKRAKRVRKVDGFKMIDETALGYVEVCVNLNHRLIGICRAEDGKPLLILDAEKAREFISALLEAVRDLDAIKDDTVSSWKTDRSVT